MLLISFNGTLKTSFIISDRAKLISKQRFDADFDDALFDLIYRNLLLIGFKISFSLKLP